MRAGEKVLVEAWTVEDGNYVKQYEVASLSTTSIELKHTATFRRRGDGVAGIPGDGRVGQYDERMIQHLSVPFEKRWQEHVSSMKWLCEQLTKD